MESRHGEVDRDDGHHDEHDGGGLEELGPGRPADLLELGDDLREEPRALALLDDGLGDRAGLLRLALVAALRSGPRARGSLRLLRFAAARVGAAGARPPGAACRLPRVLPSCGSDARHRQSALHRSSWTNRAGGTRTPNPRFWRPVLYQLSYDPTRTPAHREAASGSPCAACACRTIGRTSGTRCGPGCSACSSLSGSSDACNLRKPSSLRYAGLLPQVDDSSPGTGPGRVPHDPGPAGAPRDPEERGGRPGGGGRRATARRRPRPGRPSGAGRRRRAGGRGPWGSPRRRARGSRTGAGTRHEGRAGLGVGGARGAHARAERLHLGDRGRRRGAGHAAIPWPPPTGRSRASPWPASNREEEAPAARAELELLLEIEDVVGAAARVGAHPQGRLGVGVQRVQAGARLADARGRQPGFVLGCPRSPCGERDRPAAGRS